MTNPNGYHKDIAQAVRLLLKFWEPPAAMFAENNEPHERIIYPLIIFAQSAKKYEKDSWIKVEEEIRQRLIQVAEGREQLLRQYFLPLDITRQRTAFTNFARAMVSLKINLPKVCPRFNPSNELYPQQIFLWQDYLQVEMINQGKLLKPEKLNSRAWAFYKESKKVHRAP